MKTRVCAKGRVVPAILFWSTTVLFGCGGGSSTSAPNFTVGGTVSGLGSGTSVVLKDNGADSLTASSNSTFTFATAIKSGGSYTVTVGTQPTGQTCIVSAGSGSISTSNVTNVSVACAATTYTVGGTVSGLASGAAVVLQDNGGDALTVSSNSTFTFATAIKSGGSYTVTVGTQPTGQTCIVSAGSGSVTTADVTNVIVQCPMETVLWSFSGGVGGGLPSAGLIQGSDGNFYGTTVAYGSVGAGTAFRLSPAGVETALWGFGTVGDGNNPQQSGLVQGIDGNFYGTTFWGGSNNGGTVFKITPGGVETVLYNFGSTGDGINPWAGVIQGSDGSFYGTTSSGGINNGGTVFKVTAAGLETVLWNFDFVSVGNAGPYGGVIQGSDGSFYGTTSGGGTNTAGTVFKITSAGVETVLWNFGSGSDGRNPQGNLTRGSDGNLYGTTVNGGANASGTVFRITPAGAETVLWNFGSAGDGRNPGSGVVQDADGNFYGTTSGGGPIGAGTVFRVTPDGVETVLWGFGSNSSGNDGAGPYGALIQGNDGNFYGTTYGGGASLLGTVFKLTL
jgi:uncharacterized repeat protein (TIGR03803 family)